MSKSPAMLIAEMPQDERERALATYDLDELMRDWRFWARPEQIAPTWAWRVWLIMTGRGWGKTRTGSEWCADRAIGEFENGALLGRTAADCRDTMVEGRSGIESVCQARKLHCKYEPSKRRVTIRLPGVGYRHSMRWTTFTGVEPDQLAGPEHDSAWTDEGASLPQVLDGANRTSWDNLMFGLRVGSNPQAVVTTTPRSTKLMRALVNRSNPEKMAEAHKRVDVALTRGTLYDNISNLAPAFVGEIVGQYAGTRLGRQEIYGQLLEDSGSFFQRTWFPAVQQPPWPTGADLKRERYYDLASGEPSDANPDPDFTVGAKVAYDRKRRLYLIESIDRFRLSPGRREVRIGRNAKLDGLDHIWIEREPGNAGKAQLHMIGGELSDQGVSVRGNPVTGDKLVRAELLATASQQGRVFIMDAEWNQAFLEEIEDFPDGPHDDQVDAVAGALQVMRPRRASGSANPADRGPLQTSVSAIAGRG